MALGEDGYNKHTANILETTQAIAKGVQTIKGIKLLGGTPEAMIVCFAGTNTRVSFFFLFLFGLQGMVCFGCPEHCYDHTFLGLPVSKTHF